MMDEALLAALLVGWAAVLLPSALRSRRDSDPHVSVGGFNHAMAVLRGRPDGREILVPRQADRIVGHGLQRPDAPRPSRAPSDRTATLLGRRRSLFVRLLATTVGTLVLAVVVGGLLWPVFLTSAVALGAYVAMLRHFKVERDQAREVVRTIDLSAHDEPDLDAEPELVAVGAEGYGVPVATSPDDPWAPQSSVRIRRWDV